MNTATTSIVGSLALALAGMIVGWLASHNIIPAADITQDTALIGTALVGFLGAALVWFKANSATLTAHIAAVNATGTVKTVPVDAPAPMVSVAPTPDVAKIAAVNAIDGVKVVPQNAPTAQISAVPPTK
jgi:hypothetical protein